MLLVLGVIALMGIAARNAGEDIRSRIGFVVIMDENASESQTAALKSLWQNAPYVSLVRYSSADEVLSRWNSTMAEEGDSITALLGINPFFPEFEVAVKPRYASMDSIEKIVAPLRKLEGVGEIKLQGDMVRSINATVNSLAVILTIVAAALLLISFVLINNTIRLSVYARRFSIHTMKLVGATAGFIRRPFILSNIGNGVVAGVIAVGVLCGALYYAGSVEPEIARMITWAEAAVVFCAVVVVGVIICTLSALFATNRYLKLGYDDMF